MKITQSKKVHSGKKIKLEHHTICGKLQKKYHNININEHEVHKFLLIFQELTVPLYTEKATENQDSVDGVTSIF